MNIINLHTLVLFLTPINLQAGGSGGKARFRLPVRFAICFRFSEGVWGNALRKRVPP